MSTYLDRNHLQGTLATAAFLRPHPAYAILRAYLDRAFGVHGVNAAEWAAEVALIEELAPDYREALAPLRKAWRMR